jgi:hypothetical protein
MILRPQNCGECGAPLRDDQRYCLQCGARHGAPRVDALAELGFASEPIAAPSAARAQEPLPVGRKTPSRRLTAALAAATLALGGAAGAAVGPAPEGASAGAGATPARVVALVMPSAAPATTTTTDDAEDEDEPPDDGGTSDTPSATTGDDDASTADPAATDEADTSSTTAEEDDTDTDGDASDTEPSSTAPSSTAPSSTTPAATVPAHVWLVSLPTADAATAFGPASPLAPLVAKGTLLSAYAAAGPTPAANQLALLGGQVPTSDCAANLAACVLPAGETSLPDQLVSLGLTWRAYVEDATQRCPATGPAARVGTSLFTTLVQRDDCATTTVGTDQLATDLKSVDATPALSLVVATTADSAKAVADQVVASKAYKKDGVVVLAPDAPAPSADPATPAAPVGALVLSPTATANADDATPTGPIALLRSVDGLFGLDPLGAAAQATAGALDPIFPPSNPSNPTRRSP